MTVQFQDIFTGIGTGCAHQHRHPFIQLTSISRMTQSAIEKAVALKATAADYAGTSENHLSYLFGLRAADPHNADPSAAQRGCYSCNRVTYIHG